MQFKIGTKTNTIELCDVKHAPDAPNNLINVGCLTDTGNTATFTGTGVIFRTGAGTIFAQGQKRGRLFHMKGQVTVEARNFAAAAKERTWDKWHRILGHINIGSIKMLKRNDLVTGLEVDETKEPSQCKACIQGKRHVELFPKRAEEDVDQIGDLTVSDVWGPAQTKGLSCEKYFYSFTDIKSRYSVIYFGNTKDEALKHFETYKAMVETQTCNKLKKFRSDT